MDNNKLTKELIEKCEKTKKGATKKQIIFCINFTQMIKIQKRRGVFYG